MLLVVSYRSERVKTRFKCCREFYHFFFPLCNWHISQWSNKRKNIYLNLSANLGLASLSIVDKCLVRRATRYSFSLTSLITSNGWNRRDIGVFLSQKYYSTGLVNFSLQHIMIILESDLVSFGSKKNVSASYVRCKRGYSDGRWQISRYLRKWGKNSCLIGKEWRKN